MKYSIFIVRCVKRFVPYSLPLPRNLNVAQWLVFRLLQNGTAMYITSYEALSMRPDILNITYKSLCRWTYQDGR
jgi:hypothetical protein